ncbi:hypothetical protein PVK06_040226 [Gossypium arboreum]|uniref:RNase H type-1 domain-containing protein n=1 Tax=Gossypium arboreum TaxID=29729 RepID=A0ABR0N7P3_GOSAR|nr:hypothetical protein PVK06_040226 [Gossypium arboreum]
MNPLKPWKERNESEWLVVEMSDLQKLWRKTPRINQLALQGRAAECNEVMKAVYPCVGKILNHGKQRPWLVVGDFNKITSLFEKKGRRLRSEHQMAAFRNVLEECGLTNLGFDGRCNLAKHRLIKDVLCPLCNNPLKDANQLNQTCQLYLTRLFGLEETSWFMKDRKVPSKIFWDLYMDTYTSVAVVLARNNKGQIMRSYTYPYDGIQDAFVAEARAFERSLLFAAEMGFLKISVEGDSLTIIRKIKSKKKTNRSSDR